MRLQWVLGALIPPQRAPALAHLCCLEGRRGALACLATCLCSCRTCCSALLPAAVFDA